MNQIVLTSLARAPDPNNMTTIVFNRGKPETIVSAECEGMRMREPMEYVHYREDEDNSICAVCGKRALVWLASAERHAGHAMRCVAEPSRQSAASGAARPTFHLRAWRR